MFARSGRTVPDYQLQADLSSVQIYSVTTSTGRAGQYIARGSKLSINRGIQLPVATRLGPQTIRLYGLLDVPAHDPEAISQASGAAFALRFFVGWGLLDQIGQAVFQTLRD